MSQWKYLRLEIGRMDSLMRQRNSSDDNNITNFCKILLNFTIVFKIFEFCSFLSLTIITVQQTFLSLADGLRDRTPELVNVFFHREMWKLIDFLLCFFSIWFIYFILENIPSSLPPCWFGFRSFSFPHVLSLANYLSLSLSLSPQLCCWCRTSAAVMWRDVIIYYPHLTPLQLTDN